MAASMMRCAEVYSDTESPLATASPPAWRISSTTCCALWPTELVPSRLRLRSFTTTRAPWAASAIAAARPMPLAAPVTTTTFSCNMNLSSMNGKYGAGLRAQNAAVALHQRGSGTRDLTRTAVRAQLTHRLDDAEQAVHAWMHARQPATVGVDRQRAAWSDTAIGDERAAFPFLAEAQIFQKQDGVDGESVVQLDDIDVVGRDTRPLHRQRPGDTGGGYGQVLHAGDLPVRMRHGSAQHMDRLARPILGNVRRLHHHRRSAVGDQAAVAHSQRGRNHACAQYLFQTHRRAAIGLRVERGPRAGRQCHLGQLLARRAVLVHVPLRYQCVSRGRIERCVRFLERKGVQLRANGGGRGDAAPTAWRGAIGDDHVATQAGPNRGCGD